MTARAVAGLVLGLALGVAHAAHAERDLTADTVSYRVRTGETLDVVAAEFYGDHRDARLLVVENRLKRPRSVGPGERLRIPVTREITTSRGDTLESLAQTYLGDAQRASYLAEFNHMAMDDSLPAGTALVIPLHVTYVATDPSSLVHVSEEVYGDARHVDLLRRYNALDKSSLDKGEVILAPVLDVRVRPSRMPGPDADGRARRTRRQAAVALAATALPRARAAALEGNYAVIETALAPLADEVDFLDAPEAVEIDLLLGRADVAFGRTDQASERFSQVLNRRPRMVMSRYRESPKVIAAWQKAGGRVEGE